MITLRTKDQNVKFHTLVALRKLDREEKQELVKHFTGGRETSSTGMTVDEMANAIAYLDDEQTGSIKRMRAKIINIARDIFGLDPRAQFQQAHYDALNKFLRKKFKEPLHKLQYEPLRNAVTAMEKWRESDMKTMLNSLLNDL